jgi:hypothetical protein
MKMEAVGLVWGLGDVLCDKIVIGEEEMEGMEEMETGVRRDRLNF